MEAEDRISEVEDRMIEINESERKKEKWIKRNEDTLRDLQDNIKCPNIRIIGVPEEEDKKKDHEKILEELIVENVPKMGKEIITQGQETQKVPKQDKPKAKQPKTHINQINEDQTQKANLKSSKGKATNNTQGDPHKDNCWSFISGQKGMAGHTSSDEREKLTTQITVPSKDLIQMWRRNQKLYRQAKAQRNQHH